MADTTAKTVMSLVVTTSDKVSDLVIKDGQLVFVRDIGRIALDFKKKRKFYNQIEELDTELARKNLEHPINGVYYFVVDKAVLWTYCNNEWKQITTPPDEIVFIGTEFPELGKEQTIYTNITDGNEHIAVWNEEAGEYHIVANRSYTMTREDVVALFD